MSVESYLLSSDFSAGLNSVQLTDEINGDDSIPSIVTRVDTHGDKVTIYFDKTLTSDGKKHLDELISKYVYAAPVERVTTVVQVLDLITGAGQTFDDDRAWHDVVWCKIKNIDSEFVSFSPKESEIKLLHTGVYKITIDLTLACEKTSRTHASTKLSLKPPGGIFSEIPGTRRSVYLRTKNVGNQSLTINWKDTFTAGSVIKLELGHSYGNSDILSYEYSYLSVLLFDVDIVA